jgi:hypothetical protein
VARRRPSRGDGGLVHRQPPESSIGRLDRGLDEAQARGWTVVSMKDDWKTIFPFGSK